MRIRIEIGGELYKPVKDDACVENPCSHCGLNRLCLYFWEHGCLAENLGGTYMKRQKIEK